jgi:prepilin-type N-terminal cleavage/methylation domain-containing protein
MKRGFTLVEMAIVLVIIGLLTGGILAGQSLVKQALLYKQITQLRNFDIAANTFRAKFNQFPGDFNKAQAYFGGSSNNGDGDNIIEEFGATETYYFWEHLISAQLIPDNLGSNGTPNGQIKETCVSVHGASTFSELYGVDNTTDRFFNLASPHWQINYPCFSAGAITAEEAYIMDSKIDNGKPTTGMLTAGVGLWIGDEDYPEPCHIPTSGHASNNIYNVGAEGKACGIAYLFTK